MTLSSSDAEEFQPFMDFRNACKQVLRVLRSRYPLNLWMVAVTEGDEWVVLALDSEGYDVQEGDVFPWESTYCYRMTRGLGPYIAPDVLTVPAYANVEISNMLKIGAYIGYPLMYGDGSLFGTLCALHPEPIDESIKQEHDIIHVQTRLLSTIITVELHENLLSDNLKREQRLSQIDALTGIYNRRGWDNFIRVEEQRCRRYNMSASIIIIDLDKLKLINDTNGHSSGDELLCRTAKCLTGVVRPFDVACRIGGDEFAVLVIEATEEMTTNLVKRLRVALEQENIDASLGWASREEDQSLVDVMVEADKNMYEEKRSKK